MELLTTKFILAIVIYSLDIFVIMLPLLFLVKVVFFKGWEANFRLYFLPRFSSKVLDTFGWEEEFRELKQAV